MDSGVLSQTVEVNTEYVHYKSPYAHRLYVGNKMNFSKEKHVLATSHWDKAMITGHSGQFQREVQEIIDRVGG